MLNGATSQYGANTQGKHNSTGMGKDLTADHKAIAKQHAARGADDGAVRSCISGKDAKMTAASLPAVSRAVPNSYSGEFKVHVSKDYMKFNAAHFIAFKVGACIFVVVERYGAGLDDERSGVCFQGFREKLHGHNYRLAVTITGQVGSDGYVVDFGEIKKVSRAICKGLNESFLVPMNSDVLKVPSEEVPCAVFIGADVV